MNPRPKAYESSALPLSYSGENFNRVFDEKKRRVRGLWERKRCYYAQLDANNGKQFKYPLHAATTVPQALTEMQVLRKTQREGKLLPPSLMGGDKGEHQNECTNVVDSDAATPAQRRS